jgi:hypothetical protein
MHMHKAEPFYTLAAIDPVWIEVHNPDTGRRRNIWVSRSAAIAPGNTIQLKYEKFLVIKSYDEADDKYVAIERATYGGGGLHGIISWMNELGTRAVFMWPAGGDRPKEVSGYVAEKMPLVVGNIYNMYGFGYFIHTGVRDGREPIFVARKSVADE